MTMVFSSSKTMPTSSATCASLYDLAMSLSCVTIDEFNSDNTRRLNLEETKAKIASLEYIQNELNGIANLAK